MGPDTRVPDSHRITVMHPAVAMRARRKKSAPEKRPLTIFQEMTGPTAQGKRRVKRSKRPCPVYPLELYAKEGHSFTRRRRGHCLIPGPNGGSLLNPDRESASGCALTPWNHLSSGDVQLPLSIGSLRLQSWRACPQGSRIMTRWSPASVCISSTSRAPALRRRSLSAVGSLETKAR